MTRVMRVHTRDDAMGRRMGLGRAPSGGGRTAGGGGAAAAGEVGYAGKEKNERRAVVVLGVGSR